VISKEEIIHDALLYYGPVNVQENPIFFI